jgi:hypothetical protein
VGRRGLVPPAAAPPSLGLICALAVALGALSLVLPFAPVYDPWAWLVWGREVGELSLDTTGGPSWKPLPVMFTTVLGSAGDAAPDLWLAVARAAWLATALLAWRVAARLAGPGRWGVVAGALAAVGTILLFDPFTAWLRQFAGGLSEPAAAALVLLAVDRALSDRHGHALAALAAASLIRPEAWPFLVLYGVWLWRRRALPTPALAVVAVAIPVLWLVPDLLGSGSALTGAERARAGTGSAAGEALDAAGRGLGLPLVVFWVASGWAALGAPRPPAAAALPIDPRAPATVRLLVAGGLAWIGVVAALAALGYTGLPRFAAPAGAAVCVTGAVGLVWFLRGALSAAKAPRPEPTAGARATRSLLTFGALVLVAAGVFQGGWRAVGLPEDAREASRFEEQVSELFALVDAVGADRLTSCGSVFTTDLLTQTALAWKLDVPLAGVSVREGSPPSRGVVLVGPGTERQVSARIAALGELLGERGMQSAYSISCAASGRAMAGVGGASR